MNKISGKVIWITGASSGIGEALVYQLARLGSRLIISSRRKIELERVKGNCPAESQNHIRILPLDLGKSDTLEVITEAAIQLYGHIDILINNGGISQRSLAKETSIKVDRRLMEVNYFGTITLTKHLLPSMIKRKQGHIVVITSMVGKIGSPYRSGYAGSKHALHGFFESLRAELWRDNIKISIIGPGFVNTKLSVNALTGSGKKLGKMDQANVQGLTPMQFATKAIKAIESNKLETYIGGRETYGILISRLFPRLFSRILRKAKVR